MMWIKDNISADVLKNNLNDKIKKIQNKKIQIGFFETATYPDGTYVATVARDNNLGTYKVPPRPFFTYTIEKNKKKWLRLLKDGIIKYKNDKALHRVGEVIKNDITKSIIQFSSPPNALSTIKKKGSSNPLIDTGLLAKSVEFKIIKVRKVKK